MWCDDPADLFRLATFVQHDIEPKRANAAYLFGHVPECEGLILATGADLWKNDRVGRLFVCKLAQGYPYDTPYRDFEAWRIDLMRLGTYDVVFPIESPSPASPEEKFPFSHTGSEAEGLVLLAKERRWEKVIVVGHPMHMLRAFTQTVGFVMKEYPSLRVYAKTAAPKSWHEHATLNQGVVNGTPFREGIDAEWKRLNAVYGNKYDPIPAKQVIEYINWRESQ